MTQESKRYRPKKVHYHELNYKLRNWYVRYLQHLLKPFRLPATHLKLMLRKADVMSNRAGFIANWIPSLSPGITEQRLVVTENGVAGAVQVLPPTQASFTFDVDSGAAVHVAVKTFNATLGIESDAVGADATAPDVTVPLPISNLTLQFTGVVPDSTPPVPPTLPAPAATPDAPANPDSSPVVPG